MALDFPASPEVGQTFSSGPRSWHWTGSYWANVTTTGTQGIQGIQGTQGTQGIQGETGAGVQGAQGTQGFTGIQGTQATLTAGNLTLPAVTTTIPNAEILFCVANDRDLVNTTSFDNLTNANLTSINERIDQTIATGTGGGLALYEATAPLAGNIGTSTLVKNAGFTTTATAAYLTIALRPKKRLSLFT